MPTPITMPQLGESVTEGTVARWLKDEGDRVERDEPLLEISTDKVNADMPSPVAGVLVRKLVAEGAVAVVGAALAEVDEEQTLAIAAPARSTGQTAAAAPTPFSDGDRRPDIAAPEHEDQENGFAARRRYSPLVKKLAAEHAIALDRVVGSGLGGRVTKHDVLAYLEQGSAATPGAPPDTLQGRVTRDDVLRYAASHAPAGPPTRTATPAHPPTMPSPRLSPPEESASTDAGLRSLPVGPAPAPGAETTLAPPAFSPTPTVAPEALPGAQRPVSPLDGASLDEERVPLTPMRRGIAEHMVRSKHTAPHATTVTEVDMTRLVSWRLANKDAFRVREGVEMTYVAFVLQAVIAALKAFPLVNASWGGDTIVVKKQLNIGIAVGMDDGLLVPVIHRADERSLVGLARAVADLAARARTRKLTVQELQGGTFTVNNTGVFGSIVSTPVINQPQAAILSMEAIVKRPVVIDDAIAIRSMMNICLSFDHRIVDGLLAGRFNQRVKQYLEGYTLPS